jgi:hypothetical protein
MYASPSVSGSGYVLARSFRYAHSHGSLYPHFCKPWKPTVSFIGLAKTPANSRDVMGNSVSATYSGKSAQSFEVVVLLKDGNTEYLTFNFPKTKNAITRVQHQQAKGPIEKVTNCSYNSY